MKDINFGVSIERIEKNNEVGVIISNNLINEKREVFL